MSSVFALYGPSSLRHPNTRVTETASHLVITTHRDPITFTSQIDQQVSVLPRIQRDFENIQDELLSLASKSVVQLLAGQLLTPASLTSIQILLQAKHLLEDMEMTSFELSVAVTVVITDGEAEVSIGAFHTGDPHCSAEIVHRTTFLCPIDVIITPQMIHMRKEQASYLLDSSFKGSVVLLDEVASFPIPPPYTVYLDNPPTDGKEPMKVALETVDPLQFVETYLRWFHLLAVEQYLSQFSHLMEKKSLRHLLKQLQETLRQTLLEELVSTDISASYTTAVMVSAECQSEVDELVGRRTETHAAGFRLFRMMTFHDKETAQAVCDKQGVLTEISQEKNNVYIVFQEITTINLKPRASAPNKTLH